MRWRVRSWPPTMLPPWLNNINNIFIEETATFELREPNSHTTFLPIGEDKKEMLIFKCQTSLSRLQQWSSDDSQSPPCCWGLRSWGCRRSCTASQDPQHGPSWGWGCWWLDQTHACSWDQLAALQQKQELMNAHSSPAVLLTSAHLGFQLLWFKTEIYYGWWTSAGC